MKLIKKKTNWLAILSILLALLLVTQTGALIYFFNKNETRARNGFPTPSQINSQINHSAFHRSAPVFPRKKSFMQHALTNPNTASQDPLSTFEEMQNDMESMMGGFMSSLPSMMTRMNQHMGIDSMPQVDMEEKDNNYIVKVDVPGLDKDKIEIMVRGEILSIEGVHETVNQEQGGSFYTQERSYGSFSRSLRLPGPVDDTNVKADYQNGVLTITLPKISPEQASKKISVV